MDISISLWSSGTHCQDGAYKGPDSNGRRGLPLLNADYVHEHTRRCSVKHPPGWKRLEMGWTRTDRCGSANGRAEIGLGSEYSRPWLFSPPERVTPASQDNGENEMSYYFLPRSSTIALEQCLFSLLLPRAGVPTMGMERQAGREGGNWASNLWSTSRFREPFNKYNLRGKLSHPLCRSRN